ncbi:MAG: hypothetical protein ABR585_13595 [Gemmatimonadaceae bacterium]
MRTKTVSAVFTVGLLFAGIAACEPSDSSVSEAPKGETKAHKKKVVNERGDLLSFKLDDRSEYGMDDIWVKWKIKNTSSEKSDYSWDWEAISKATGERVANSTEFETNVLPGQVVRGEDPTTLDTSKVTINITSFDRTQSW